VSNDQSDNQFTRAPRTEETLERLIDRREIQDVISRLARAQDRLDRDAIISCYHEDASDDHNVFRGDREEFADWVIGFLSELFEETTHAVSPAVIDLRGDIAQVNSQCICHHLSRAKIEPLPGESVARTDLIIGMRYLDKFERRHGEWRIARRICPFDWGYFSAFNGTIYGWHEEGMTVGARNSSDPSYEVIS
jgi:hypothetical protein